MNVPSLQFLALGAVAAVLFHLWRAQGWRQAVMLAVNLGFFATFLPRDPMAAIPYAGFLLLGYLAVARRAEGRWGWLLVAAIIASFFWLKRYSFVPAPLLLGFPYVTIGLSYVFFRVLHLAIDRQQDSLEARPGPVSYVNYVLNFTSLVSGPIQRYEDYHAMERAPLPLGILSFGVSAERVVVGFFKVFVVSAALSGVQQGWIARLAETTSFWPQLGLAAGIVAIYPVYLYANFSGYTDFVIGVARWFGLVLPENFNRPFQSENFQIFWSRWHITLSTWLKTYVYQPLLLTLMTRVPNPRMEQGLGVICLFVTFFLVGAWHGQTSSFLFYGVLQGAGVSCNKLYQLGMAGWLGRKGYRELAGRPLYRAVARGVTFAWFAFTLLWFWADWGQLAGLRAALRPDVLAAMWPALIVGATVVLAAWTGLFGAALGLRLSGQSLAHSRYSRVVWNTALLAVSLGVLALLNAPAPPIVYKNF